MKSRIMMSVLVIALAAALIAGATAAWFTAETDLPTAEFKAGTVIISADEEGPTYATAPCKSFKNVNPGDCGKVTWEIINEGTKKIELRVKLSELWIVGEDEEALSTDNFFYAPAPGSDWVMYEEDGEIWLYYTGGPVAGTFNPDGEPFDPVSVELSLIVAFDGPSTGNEYQGREFELSGLVEAVQASNGAPNAEWGDVWSEVNDEDYTPSGSAGEYLEYIMDTPCWDVGEETPS